MDDFLDKVWQTSKLYINKDFKKVLNAEQGAVILSISQKNYDRYIALNSIQNLLNSMNLDFNEYSIELLQVGILNAIKQREMALSPIRRNLEILLKEDIIDFSHFDIVNKYLDSLNINEENIENNGENLIFHKNLSMLNEIYNELLTFKYDSFKDRLDIAFNNASNARFYIAVTGVINAGKSSTLNALMNKQILGTSNVPETANLSIITYSKNENARVVFWSNDELKKMHLEPKNNENLKDEIIPLENLKQYSTAKNDISQFVKEIILGIDLELLKDGINIVDTPGLDDAVILREELTRDYMQKSDCILHLMNASQSATKKDMSFICDMLQNTKNSKLIIALTHIDKLQEQELNEVLNYTKKSIEVELKEYGFESTLIDDVKFFLLSAPQNKGIDELRHFLYESFFGENSARAKLIIDNYKKELLLVSEFIKKDLDSNIMILNSDNLQIEESIQNLHKQRDEINGNIKECINDIDELIKKMDYSNFNGLIALKSVSAKVSDRIINDVKYYKSKGKKIDFDRILVITQSGFNDAFIDFFRDFKQAISNDINNLYEMAKIKLGFSEMSFDSINILDFINKNTPSIDYSSLKENIIKTIKATSDTDILVNKINEINNGFLHNLNLANVLNILAKNSTSEFLAFIKNESQRILETLKNKDENLNAILNESIKNQELKHAKLQNLTNDLNNISNIINRIQSC